MLPPALLPQPDTGPAPVFGDELDAGTLERGADRLTRTSAAAELACGCLEALDRRQGHARSSGKVGLRPAQQGACGLHLLD